MKKQGSNIVKSVANKLNMRRNKNNSNSSTRSVAASNVKRNEDQNGSIISYYVNDDDPIGLFIGSDGDHNNNDSDKASSQSSEGYWHADDEEEEDDEGAEDNDENEIACEEEEGGEEEYGAEKSCEDDDAWYHISQTFVHNLKIQMLFLRNNKLDALVHEAPLYPECRVGLTEDSLRKMLNEFTSRHNLDDIVLRDLQKLLILLMPSDCKANFILSTKNPRESLMSSSPAKIFKFDCCPEDHYVFTSDH
jgi:hypothetical protein